MEILHWDDDPASGEIDLGVGKLIVDAGSRLSLPPPAVVSFESGKRGGVKSAEYKGLLPLNEGGESRWTYSTSSGEADRKSGRRVDWISEELLAGGEPILTVWVYPSPEGKVALVVWLLRRILGRLKCGICTVSREDDGAAEFELEP